MLRKKLWSNLYQCLIMYFEANHYFPSQIIRESFIFNASQGCSTNIIIEVHGSSFSISMLCLLCWLNDPLKVCSGRCVYISCFSRQQLISTQRQKGEAGGNLENQKFLLSCEISQAELAHSTQSVDMLLTSYSYCLYGLDIAKQVQLWFTSANASVCSIFCL